MYKGKTNKELIQEVIELQGINFNYDGTNLKTFAEWRKCGYVVQKGQKAFIKVKLWTPIKKKEKDKKGNEIEVTKFYLKMAALFTRDQVKPLEKKQEKTA